MDHRVRARRVLVLGLLGLCLATVASGQQRAGTRARDIQIEQFRPKWRVGDTWVVETTTLQVQAADGQQQLSRSKPIQWQFAVRAIEKLQGQDCYRIEASPVLPGQSQAATILWVDRQSLGLRQVQSKLRVAGEERTMTESYRFTPGQSSPVQSPITALPVDLPVFVPNEAKGAQSFSYKATTAIDEEKAFNDTAFLVNIEQELSPTDLEGVKSLLPEEFTKDLQARPVIEVRLKSVQGQVRQLWQAGAPWPVFADNGTTRARLLEVKPAAPEGENVKEVKP